MEPNKYRTINNIIEALNQIKVSGETDMNYLLGSIQTLRELIKVLKQEDGYNQGQIDTLMKKIGEIQNADTEVQG